MTASSARRPLRVLVLNTFLLRVLPIPARFGLKVSGAPYVDKRARELQSVLTNYDVAALCEAFAAREILTLRGAHPDFRTTSGATFGPPSGSGRLVSSGLLTLSRLPTTRTSVHRFAESGSRVHDPDAYAAKGVMLAELELPNGKKLEVFNTHLIAGDDLVPRQWMRRDTNQLEDIRLAQLEEVMAFVTAHRRPENPALIVGDFNIEADTTAGKTLAKAMGDAGLLDTWAESQQGSGATVGLEDRPEYFISDPTDERFFADINDPAPVFDTPAPRIDYAFFDPGDSGVTVAKIRRRALPRPVGADGRDLIAWMSDHAGLHLELNV